VTGTERQRVEGFGQLENGLLEAGAWYRWGPYVSERQWGTVREDYSADGDAWAYLPHDHARSRAYRWGEDAMAGFSDIEQRLCLGLALWNGEDPILKERMFGLTGAQANHGEDVKEYWWYLDAVPSHAWNRWRYHYPQAAFPYADLVAENGRRGKHDPEYELLDTGVFDDDRYWVVDVDYVKADPDDVIMVVRATNAGRDAAKLHLLPTAWFRNTWSWDHDAPRPTLGLRDDGVIGIEHPTFGPLELLAGPGPDGSTPPALFCDNETNAGRLFGSDDSPPYPKDGINDHVVGGAETVNPDHVGTKVSLWYQLDVPGGDTAEVRLRLRPRGSGLGDGALGADADRVVAERRREADEFYAELTPPGCSPDEAMVMRQAFAGMLWSKQLYAYDVTRWLEGDPTQPPPPVSRRSGRNSRWTSFDAFDIMSMPDPWEYPWFAAWDLGFHCVALAHLDPAFAKYQLLLLCREWFQHPNGALPAYEWDFGDVNPPVQAWAALEVFAIDGARDVDFLSRVFDKLMVNFTWWVNLEDEGGCNLFEGGFLGLDNIGPIDRSHLPVGGTLQQSDATGWMAFYALAMATMAIILHRAGERPASDLVLKFLEHFADIRRAMEISGVWDEADGLYYDKLLTPDGTAVPVKVRSMVGIIPLLAAVIVDHGALERTERLGKGFARLVGELGGRKGLSEQGLLRGEPGDEQLLLGVVGVDRLERLLTKLLDPSEFLSAHGLRAVSAYHREHPYELDVEGLEATIDYEPAESTTAMFGGNSNWRGPIWFPLNYLVVDAIERYSHFFGADLLIEYPTRSGDRRNLGEIAADLRRRLIGIFTAGPDGRRPCFGQVERLQSDPRWRNNLTFNEYFNGDDAAGLGATHQTGWTGLVADLIRGRPGDGVYTIAEAARVVRDRRLE
jgi:Mannosylglycerate hydrolase MGH1-like glycoside hydrolase domain